MVAGEPRVNVFGMFADLVQLAEERAQDFGYRLDTIHCYNEVGIDIGYVYNGYVFLPPPRGSKCNMVFKLIDAEKNAKTAMKWKQAKKHAHGGRFA